MAGSGSGSYSSGGPRCTSRGTHLPSLSQRTLSLIHQDKTGRQAGQYYHPGISAPGQARPGQTSRVPSASLMRFPGAPLITGSLNQRDPPEHFKISPRVWPWPLAHLDTPSWGPHTQPTTPDSCLTSSGILCTFFKPHWP